ncbi:DUF680 domain-containing protein [Mesorhizobium sp. ES1-1]|uniref:DUF680 domain-containing protein n=1 Tax=Mesorhizobium sp. ES1-1 TaxID=2876629 RepID=UPI001CC9F9AA|nr:DUF680 domain-containing protein [Mesorhizobium sp. ES1-1]MBZ9678679.1 DUF680 domain-containing protein [Mesorhizobium sp. ES1-1]
MKNIALTAAAILLATTGAFAGSDHFGQTSARPAAATVDTIRTASIRKADMAAHDMKATTKSDADEPGQGIWGN